MSNWVEDAAEGKKRIMIVFYWLPPSEREDSQLMMTRKNESLSFSFFLTFIRIHIYIYTAHTQCRLRLFVRMERETEQGNWAPESRVREWVRINTRQRGRNGLSQNMALGNALAMLLQISFLTIRHREKGRSPCGNWICLSFVRLCCLKASICLLCFQLSSPFFLYFLLCLARSQEDDHK